MKDNLFDIAHLLEVEKGEQDDLNSIPYEDKMDISKLLRSKDSNRSMSGGGGGGTPKDKDYICTFDPNKANYDKPEIYESLDKSLHEIDNDKKTLMLCSIKQFKKQLVDMIVVINNFFDSFTTELHKDNDIDQLYRNYMLSLDQIKQSMNDIFETAEASIPKEPLGIETLKSLKPLESSLKGSLLGSSERESSIMKNTKSSKFGLSNLANKSVCNNPNTINYVIDRLISEYKEQNIELKKDMEKFKNKIFIYENLIISSKRLIEDIYTKNKFLKEKLIKYKLSK
jgi:hypothetical protein